VIFEAAPRPSRILGLIEQNEDPKISPQASGEVSYAPPMPPIE
jgi:hypothetical protein